jgi:hypothetical protein
MSKPINSSTRIFLCKTMAWCSRVLSLVGSCQGFNGGPHSTVLLLSFPPRTMLWWVRQGVIDWLPKRYALQGNIHLTAASQV